MFFFTQKKPKDKSHTVLFPRVVSIVRSVSFYTHAETLFSPNKTYFVRVYLCVRDSDWLVPETPVGVEGSGDTREAGCTTRSLLFSLSSKFKLAISYQALDASCCVEQNGAHCWVTYKYISATVLGVQ